MEIDMGIGGLEFRSGEPGFLVLFYNSLVEMTSFFQLQMMLLLILCHVQWVKKKLWWSKSIFYRPHCITWHDMTWHDDSMTESAQWGQFSKNCQQKVIFCLKIPRCLKEVWVKKLMFLPTNDLEFCHFSTFHVMKTTWSSMQFLLNSRRKIPDTKIIPLSSQFWEKLKSSRTSDVWKSGKLLNCRLADWL